MDGFLNFLANYYIWFLVAAGIFLFALIGLIIDSAKKRKSKNADMIESGDAPVESFRYEEAAPAPTETTTETVTEVAPAAPAATPAPEVAPAPATEEVTTVIEPTVTEVAAPTFDGAPVNDFPVDASPAPEAAPAPTEVPVAPAEPAPVMDATPVMEPVTTETPTTM